MKQQNTYRFITFILLGLLMVAFSQSFAKVEKVEKAHTEQSKDQDTDQEKHEHVLKTYEAVMSMDQNVTPDDVYFPAPFFPESLNLTNKAVEELTISTLPYFEVLFETSICTNAP